MFAQNLLSLMIVLVLLFQTVFVFSFVTRSGKCFSKSIRTKYFASQEKGTAATSASSSTPLPVLNGKRVLPFKLITTGLKDHRVPAVYAILNSLYQRGSEGWEATVYVGVTQDLHASLISHASTHPPEQVAHVRALSFSFPEPNAMQEVADQWRKQASDAGAKLDSAAFANDIYLFDNDEEDEDDAWDIENTEQVLSTLNSDQESPDAVVSPFQEGQRSAVSMSVPGTLDLTRENVDKVLDEVRPYLIADGGNVSVENVDVDKKAVYLKLEGACGSCPSSTVTMQMGIERVLKEKFPTLSQVLQIDDDIDSQPTELTWEAVEAEVRRLTPAIAAMGGSVELTEVDPAGVVGIKFRGSKKVRQGLELAILDVPFVKLVEFEPEDE